MVALKLVAGVIEFRLRRLEMANLAATVSLAVALHLGPVEIALRTAFALALNVLLYLNNDWNDVAIDLRNVHRRQDRVRFLAMHSRTALRTQIVIGAALVAAAVAWSPSLLVPLLLGGGTCIWYSSTLKRRPGLDVLAMTLGGAALPLCGAPTLSPTIVCLAVQLGLYSAVFQMFQLQRDAKEDSAAGVRTTAVVLGQAATIWLLRALMLLVSLYAALATSPWIALVTFLALAIPERAMGVKSRWTLIRLVYGGAWVLLCVQVFLHERCEGLAWVLARGALHG